jgi:hypothetical protein
LGDLSALADPNRSVLGADHRAFGVDADADDPVYEGRPAKLIAMQL